MFINNIFFIINVDKVIFKSMIKTIKSDLFEFSREKSQFLHYHCGKLYFKIDPQKIKRDVLGDHKGFYRLM